MSKDNHFQQYGYDHYLKSPKKNGTGGYGRQEGLFSRLRLSSSVVSLSLIAAAVILTGIIVISYPSKDKEYEKIAVVQADLRPVKIVPKNHKGQKIPNKDSTILARVGEPPQQGSKKDIENLMEAPREDLLSKDQSLAIAMAEGESSNNYSHSSSSSSSSSHQDQAGDILRKIDNSDDLTGGSKNVSDSSSNSLPDPRKLHAAGTSPETQDFVREALSKSKEVSSSVSSDSGQYQETAIAGADNIGETKTRKGGVTSSNKSLPSKKVANIGKNIEKTAESLNKVSPASGISSGQKIKATSGNYFIQLASVRSRDGASREWKKLIKKYSPFISGISHRVQQANLGSRGTFYRIQVGPLSKQSASEICQKIKAANPGGSLVVKR